MTSKLRLMIKEEAKPHILLVEDARDIREPLARYLREHSYRATTAQDAASARKVMKAAAIDLVVHIARVPGGARRVVEVAEVRPPGIAGPGERRATRLLADDAGLHRLPERSMRDRSAGAPSASWCAS